MVDQVGLVIITILYRASDLSRDLPCETFTNLYHRTGGITHSDWTMCYAGL